jgi:hypothetical protein
MHLEAAVGVAAFRLEEVPVVVAFHGVVEVPVEEEGLRCRLVALGDV